MLQPFPEGFGPVAGSAHAAYVADFLAAIPEPSESLSDIVGRNALDQSDGAAFVDDHGVMTWREYDLLATQLAEVLAGLDLERGSRVLVVLPDGALVHVAFLALERAGLVIVGVGPRAEVDEIQHLARVTRAGGVVTGVRHRDGVTDELVAVLRAACPWLRHHVTVDAGAGSAMLRVNGGPVTERRPVGDRGLAPNELWLVNSTSGTTGLPKCVAHTQSRWLAFHDLAVEAGGLRGRETFLTPLPSPLGFGLWAAHVTPARLGATTVLMERFEAAPALRLLDYHGVGVLACVTTQLLMLLNRPEFMSTDLGKLRVVFTGGEAVPPERALAFEEGSNSLVLQFYGSNETGAISRTSTADDTDHRLATAGRVVESMHVRLLDPAANVVSGKDEPGQVLCRGATTSIGYFGDDDANKQLFTDDGWVRTGDLATIDHAGYLRIVGRLSDLIIRGGKNISAIEVERAVSTCEAVALVAAVPVPDEVLGERIGVYVELRTGGSLDLASLKIELEARGVPRRLWPEHLVVLDELPRVAGKVAKGRLRAWAKRDAGSEPPGGPITAGGGRS